MVFCQRLDKLKGVELFALGGRIFQAISIVEYLLLGFICLRHMICKIGTNNDTDKLDVTAVAFVVLGFLSNGFLLHPVQHRGQLVI